MQAKIILPLAVAGVLGSASAYLAFSMSGPSGGAGGPRGRSRTSTS